MSLPHIVLQYNDLQHLNFMQQGSSRLRVACFDLCPSYIILGANSGTIYVLDHDSLKLKHQIPTGNGSVVQISISPDENYVAYALSNGSVEVFEILGQDGSGCRHLIGSREHEGQIVSSVTWSQNSIEVYIGDTVGKVSVLYVPRMRTASLFRSSCVHLMTLESAITQLDYSEGHLLVSTLERSYICNTSLETFAQIGTKLRKGEFGSCFCRVNLACSITVANQQSVPLELDESVELSQTHSYSPCSSQKFELSDCYEATEEKLGKENVQQPSERPVRYLQQGVTTRVFCARPGSRIWEADTSGKVLVTHQLKKALMIPPIEILLTDGSFGSIELLKRDMNIQTDKNSKNNMDIFTANEESDAKGKSHADCPMNLDVPHPPVGVAFTKMLNFYSSFLIAVSSFGLYVIDPSNSTVVLWIRESDGIVDVKVSGSTVIYRTGSGVIQNYMITTVDVAILVLHNRNFMIECARLCLQYQEVLVSSQLLNKLGTKILADLIVQIAEESVREKFQNLEKLIRLNLEKESQDETNPSKSGITYIRNDQFNSSEIKLGLRHALRLSHHTFLPPSITRCYSEPQLGYGQDKNAFVHRSSASVETSPSHEVRGTNLLSNTSGLVHDLQSTLSLTNYSSKDTLQSLTMAKLRGGFGSHSEGSERKSGSSELSPSRTLSSSTHSSGKWSQQSDNKSQKCLESSQEMYEDPLFPPGDSSPDLEMNARMYMEGRHYSSSLYQPNLFYSLPYGPINPSSETAAIVQDLMENAATNVVSSLAMGTKSLKEKLRGVAPLKLDSDMSPLRPNRGPFSVADIVGNSAGLGQEDPFQSSASGTDETDGFDVDIVIKTKPKKKGHRKSALTSPVLSRCSTLPDVDDILRPVGELPGVVKNLHELVMSTMKQITNTDNKSETKDLLTHWLEVYCNAVQQIQQTKSTPPSNEEPLDGPVSISSVDSSFSVGSAETSCDSLNWDSNDIGFEPSAVSADILERITYMFLRCMLAEVFSKGNNTPLSNKGVMQHPITPERVKKLDSHYAQLITNDCGLLHYPTLLNSLDTLRKNYYLLTWCSLLDKLTKESDPVGHYPLPDIISDLDFTRSQRVSFLFKLISGGNLGGNLKNLVVAASQIQNPYVILDVIFILNFALAKANDICSSALKLHNINQCLFQYVTEIAQNKDVREIYLTYWSWCPELQYDILSALLSALFAVPSSCSCGMPVPRSFRLPLENLLETIIMHHILDPENIMKLCQTAGFWRGYCTVSMAYNLHANSDCFPYVLQTCDIDLIENAVDYLKVSEFPAALNSLVAITSTNKAVLKCSKCQTNIELVRNFVQNMKAKDDSNPFIFKFRVNGNPQYKEINLEDTENKTDKEQSRDLSDQFDDTVQSQRPRSPSPDMQISRQKPLTNIGQLWETVIVQILRRCKTADVLGLLKSVHDDIPPGVIPQKIYSWCILLSLVEHKGQAVRWKLLDSLTHCKIKPYSKKVAEAMHRLEPSLAAKKDVKDMQPESCKTMSREFLLLGHHWGVRSQILLGTCHFCQLRLPESALVSEGGITVFPCSHAYHAICLAQRGYYCIICAKQESQRLQVA
ncbi:hypothetical protein SK128_006491 [Halocaridina rubra]|uniref:HPS5-like beta-propeller domain-containing protein n=1 Tax=Halocaridina rubra TaxID=373956 RepID=A0AAN9AHD8_HALRR